MLADNITIWAKEGGLIGLVLFSLFALILLFIHVLSKKDKNHTNFIERILDSEKAERREIHDQHTNTYNRLSSSLDNLSEELRKRKNS